MAQILAPSCIVNYVDGAALHKVLMRAPRLWVMAMLGGMYIALGGLLALVVAGGATKLLVENPGLDKLLFGAVFPVGFIAVVLTGADLFTSNCAMQMVPLFRRKISFQQLLKVFSVSYMGNAVGAIFAAWAFAYMTGMLDVSHPWTAYVMSVAEHKVHQPFMVAFMKGVLANILVCVGAWQGYSSKDTLGRMVGIWAPVMAFVALGMEHSIANLFFVPAAMMGGLDVTVGEFLWNNLLPVTLGNIVGGSICIGLPYAWLYSEANGGEPQAAVLPVEGD